jgi:hypothetical protein
MPDAIDKILSELSLNDSAARDRITKGFARRTQLTPEQEKQFQADAIRLGHDPKTFDDPTYDMRAAWLAGRLNPASKHGQSDFKGLEDDRLFLPIGAGGRILDTRTAQPSPGAPANAPWTGATPDPRLLNLWRIVSGVTNAK